VTVSIDARPGSDVPPEPAASITRSMLGRLWKLRMAPEMLLHPWHRGRARARLTRSGERWKVLILCHGNICRSPFAEVLLRRQLGEHGADCQVESAGFLESGRPCPEPALLVAREFGLDLSEHRSRTVTPAMIGDADLTIVMEPSQAAAVTSRMQAPPGRVLTLGDLDPDRFVIRRLPDPYDRPLDEFRSCFRRIDRCLQVVARTTDASTARRRIA